MPRGDRVSAFAGEWKRLGFCLLLCLASLGILAVATRWFCRRNPAVLVSDPTLATSHLLHDLQGVNFRSTCMTVLKNAGNGHPDVLFVSNEEYSAKIQIDDGVVTFLDQAETGRAFPLVLSVPGPPSSGCLWSLQWPDTTSARLLLVDASSPYSVRKTFSPIPAWSSRRSAVGRLGLAPVVVWPPDAPRRVYAAVASSGPAWPRGMAAFDFATGALLWRYAMAQDPQMVIARDVNGDSEPEFFIAGWAPANGSELAGGRTDTTCSLIALDAHGKELWYRERAQTFDYSTAVMGRMSPDGQERIIWVVSTHRADAALATSMYAVDPASGQITAEQRFPGSCFSPVLADLEGSGNLELVGGISTGQVMAWDGRLHLVRNHAYDGPAAVLQAGDLDDDGRPNLIGTIGGRLCVLDERLRIQALGHVFVNDAAQCLRTSGPAYTAIVHEGDGRSFLAVRNEDLTMNVFSLRARTPDEGLGLNARQILPFLAAALVIGASAGGLVLGGRRRRSPGRTAVEGEVLSPSLVKALHQEISGMLHAVDRTNPLVRVQQLLDFARKGNAIGVQHLSRIADACDAFLAEGHPGLVGLSEKIGSARSELPELASLEESYRELTTLIEGWKSAGYPVHQIQASASRGEGLADASLEGLRSLQARLRSRLRCDLTHALDHAIRTSGPGIQDAVVESIDVRIEGSSQPAVLCDSADLQRVLADMIDNSLRAMKESREKRIRFTIRRRASTVLLAIEDTGKGIAPDRWERIFGRDGSDREGGGFGLPNARRVLQEYKGWCEVEWSEPGAGTRMLLSFQADADPGLPGGSGAADRPKRPARPANADAREDRS